MTPIPFNKGREIYFLDGLLHNKLERRYVPNKECNLVIKLKEHSTYHIEKGPKLQRKKCGITVD